eukprot:879027-Pelagomonas_calceolata.AAC.1
MQGTLLCLEGREGYEGKWPPSRRLTAILFVNAHEIIKEEGNFVVILRADLEVGTSEQHMFFILYLIGITDITDRRNTIGTNSLFNSKSVYSQPESGSVAKNVMGKIQ